MARLLRKKVVGKNKKKDTNTDLISSVSGLSNSGSGMIVTEVPKGQAITDPKKSLFSPKKPINEAGIAHQFIQKWTWLERTVLFLREVKIELKKVTWPSRKQTIGSTIVVVTMVLIISIFLGVVDVGLSGLVRILLQ